RPRATRRPHRPTPRPHSAVRGPPRTVLAAPVPLISENPPSPGLPAALQPLGYGNFKGASEEGQEFGPEARVKSFRIAGSDAHQPDRARAADREPQESLRANKTSASAEQDRIGLNIVRQERVAVGSQ